MVRIESKEARHILANNIAYFRLKNGWTQEQFAEKLGSQANYVSTVEHAKRNVRIDYVGHIAEIFEIELEQLFLKRETILCHRVKR